MNSEKTPLLDDRKEEEQEEENKDGETDKTANATRPSRKTRLAKTALINLSFMMTLGLFGSSLGPTLLDLQDIYGASAEDMSFLFLFTAIGSLVGAFISGYLMDKFEGWQNTYIFVHTIVAVVTMSLHPFCGELWILFVVGAINGVTSGSINTAGNLMCLTIWRGFNSGPYMHSIHFSFAAGSLLAPLLSTPFLAKSESAYGEEGATTNYTKTTDSATPESLIGIYYPIVGVISLLVALGYLHFTIEEVKAAKQKQEKKKQLKLIPDTSDGDSDEDNSGEEEEEKEGATVGTSSGGRPSWNVIGLICVLVPFFFVYVGTEVAIGNYLTSFAVNCDLHLSRVEGARLTAIYWATFALMRFLAIFAALKLNPLIIMVFNLVSCLVCTGVLAFLAESSFVLLQACVAVLGFGMASIYATGLLWVEEHVTMTGYMTSLFTVADAAGPQVYPVLVGQFIESEPMFLMYLSFGSVIFCAILFVVASYFAIKAGREQRGDTKQTTAE